MPSPCDRRGCVFPRAGEDSGSASRSRLAPRNLCADQVNNYNPAGELGEIVDATKELVIAELDNIIATIEKLQALLAYDELTQENWALMLSLQDDLAKHCGLAVDLAKELNAQLTPYVDAGVNKVVGALKFIDAVARDAYGYFSEIPADYLAWVEEVRAYADKIDVALGDAVEKYLIEAPSDAMSIFFAYGEEAVEVLIGEALVIYGDAYTAVVNLFKAVADNAIALHEIYKNSPEILDLLHGENGLTETIKAAKAILAGDIADLSAAYTKYKNAYETLGRDGALDLVYTELVKLHNKVYPVVINALHEIDPYAAARLNEAYDALTTILCDTYVAANGYMGWLAGHAQAMACEILCSILDNTVELLVAASPIMDNWMYNWLYNNPETTIAFFVEYGDEIAKIGEKYGYIGVGIVGYLAYTYGEDVVDFVIENPEESIELFCKWYEKYGYRILPLVHVYMDALGICKCGDIDGFLAQLRDFGHEVLGELLAALYENYGVEAEALIENLKAMIYDATHAEICACGINHNYVALGGAITAGEGLGRKDSIYTELLAEVIAGLVKKPVFIDLSSADLNVNNLVEYIYANAAEIAGADLITYNMDATGIINVLLQGEKYVDNWSAYLDEEALAIADNVIAQINALLAKKYDATVAAIADELVETVVYATVGFGFESYKALETITEINDDAAVLVVGMYNPFADMTVTINGEVIAIGEYFDYAIEAIDLYYLLYAAVSGNVTFVEANDVELNGTLEIEISEDMDVTALVMQLLSAQDMILANAEGHEYIYECIMDAIEFCDHGYVHVPYYCDGGEDCPCRRFVDLDNTKWYHFGVDYMIVKGMMIGVGHDRFAPEQIITRAEVATMLWRLEGSPEASIELNFSDVAEDTWYTEAVRWAVETETFLGYGNETFGPNDQITREQIALVMYRYEEARGADLTADKTIADFADAAAASDWAVESLNWAYSTGMMIGTGSNNMNPLGDASRAEVATILYRYLDLIVERYIENVELD